MSVLVINLSIDAPDYARLVDGQYTYADDLSVNEVESVSEWILEHVFNLSNAVPESDDNDETAFGKTIVDYLFISTPQTTAVCPSIWILIPQAGHHYSPSLWLCDAILILIQPPNL